MISSFQFDDSGRRFLCTVETPSHAGMQPWWWYSVVAEGDTTRYAPFEASPGDTKESVKKRIIAHYAEVLAIKARPVHARPTWQRPAPAAAASAPPPQANVEAISAPVAE